MELLENCLDMTLFSDLSTVYKHINYKLQVGYSLNILITSWHIVYEHINYIIDRLLLDYYYR